MTADEGQGRVELEGGLDAVDEGVVARLGITGRGRRSGKSYQADRATGDLEHVDDRPGQAAARFVDRSHSGGGDRRVEDADTKAGDDKAGDDCAVALVRGDEGDQQRSAARQAVPIEASNFGPRRSYRGPAMNETVANTAIIGSIPAPVWIGVKSSTFNMYCGRYSIARRQLR